MIDEVGRDLAGPHAMHRLLQGDVGSGKTVVAISALLVAVQGGHQGALMAPIVLAMGLTWRVSYRLAALITFRAILLILSTYSFVAAVVVMPIADALAIVFVEPFVLLIFGHLIFGDQVGPRRIIASFVGFFGALLVIQPSLSAFGSVALYPLATAFLFAGYMLVTRAISSHMHPVTQQLHTSIAGSVICLAVMIWADGTGMYTLDPVMPLGWAWVWLFGVGFWAAASHMCMTLALKFAPATTLAPIHYLEIVSAVGLGYFVFGDFPNRMTWVGIVVIVASGLYIIQRERLTAGLTHAAPARLALPPEI